SVTGPENVARNSSTTFSIHFGSGRSCVTFTKEQFSTIRAQASSTCSPSIVPELNLRYKSTHSQTASSPHNAGVNFGELKYPHVISQKLSRISTHSISEPHGAISSS